MGLGLPKISMPSVNAAIATVAQVAPISENQKIIMALSLALSQAAQGNTEGAMATASAPFSKESHTVFVMPATIFVAKANRSLAIDLLVHGLEQDNKKELANLVSKMKIAANIGF